MDWNYLAIYLLLGLLVAELVSRHARRKGERVTPGPYWMIVLFWLLIIGTCIFRRNR